MTTKKRASKKPDNDDWLRQYQFPERAIELGRNRVSISRRLRALALELESVVFPVLTMNAYSDWTESRIPDFRSMPNKLREIAEHIKTFDALGLPQKRGRKPSALYAKIHAKVEDSIKRTGNKRYAKIADDLGLDMSGNEIKKAYDRHRRQIEILFEGQRIRNAKANKPSR